MADFILTARASAHPLLRSRNNSSHKGFSTHPLLRSRNNSSRNEEAYANCKYTGEKQKLPSEESNPVTDPFGENSRNPAKEQERVKT